MRKRAIKMDSAFLGEAEKNERLSYIWAIISIVFMLASFVMPTPQWQYGFITIFFIGIIGSANLLYKAKRVKEIYEKAHSARPQEQ